MKQGTLLLKNTKMKLSGAKIAQRKKQLARLKTVCGSWRIVQRDYYPELGFQLLNRFACDKKYVPSSVEICKALDLLKDPPSPYRALPRWFKRTPEALNFFNRKREQVKQLSASSRDATRRKCEALP